MLGPDCGHDTTMRVSPAIRGAWKRSADVPDDPAGDSATAARGVGVDRPITRSRVRLPPLPRAGFLLGRRRRRAVVTDLFRFGITGAIPSQTGVAMERGEKGAVVRFPMGILTENRWRPGKTGKHGSEAARVRRRSIDGYRGRAGTQSSRAPTVSPTGSTPDASNWPQTCGS